MQKWGSSSRTRLAGYGPQCRRDSNLDYVTDTGYFQISFSGYEEARQAVASYVSVANATVEAKVTFRRID